MKVQNVMPGWACYLETAEIVDGRVEGDLHGNWILPSVPQVGDIVDYESGGELTRGAGQIVA